MPCLGLYSLGVVTNRDEWVYDFDDKHLVEKVGFFCTTYENEMHRLDSEGLGSSSIGDWVDRSIKWTSELEAHLLRRSVIDFDQENICVQSIQAVRREEVLLRTNNYAPQISDAP